MLANSSDWTLDLLICPGCRSSISRSGDALACGNSHVVRRDGPNYLFDTAQALSAEWSEMQRGSIERYQHESYNDEELPILRLFGGFIAVQLPPDPVVLDIGCGLTATRPAYIDELGIDRYIGLEPLAVPVSREYPCLVGAVAERLPVENASVDAVIFATSLDHIEAEDEAIAECRRVLKPGGRIVIWQGLHEPKYLAASKTFEPIFARGSLWKRVLRIAAAPLEYGLLGYRMLRRARQLRTGERIDDAHCRYYTEAMMTASIRRWGLTETRRIIVPGTASMFVEAVQG